MAQRFLSYGRQVIEEDDLEAVRLALQDEMLTTGPMVDRFEQAFAHEVGADHAVVCNSGTAALYIAARAAGLGEGDTVIVPSVTFLATASSNVLAGVDVLFADVDPDTGLMRVEDVEEALSRAGSKKVKALFPVHLAGRVEDPQRLHKFADERGLVVIEDACHALGTRYGNAAVSVGACKDSLMACFSFHPVKSIAMGEGGAVTTNDRALAEKLKRFRNHGMNRDMTTMVTTELAFDRGEPNPWYYELPEEPSHNFRASDINCALGLSQLRKLHRFVDVRAKLVERYRARLAALEPRVRFAPVEPGVRPGWHLATVLVDFGSIGLSRRELMARLKARGIGTQVHYIPVHLQPFYRRKAPDLHLPGALSYYERTLSLPLFAAMTEADVDRVVDALAESIKR
jgi:UDP-4-amino-4,6-dideoxy-N-acetyl-beta-L-altrosamine transaminase